jgi:hypothetical protein
LLLILFEKYSFFLLYLDLSNKNIYKYFIDNRKTTGRQSVVFKLRELNSTEMKQFCPRKLNDNPPIFDEPVNFTSNYELRIYSSGCYYLDQYNNWQSDGLWVRCSMFSIYISIQLLYFSNRWAHQPIIIKHNVFPYISLLSLKSRIKIKRLLAFLNPCIYGSEYRLMAFSFF